MHIPTYQSDEEMLKAMGKVLHAITTLFNDQWTLDLYCKIRKEESVEHSRKRRALIHKIAGEIEILADCVCKDIVKKADTRADGVTVEGLRDTQTLLHVTLTACPRPPPPPSQYVEPTMEEIINDLIAETPLV